MSIGLIHVSRSYPNLVNKLHIPIFDAACLSELGALPPSEPW